MKITLNLVEFEKMEYTDNVMLGCNNNSILNSMKNEDIISLGQSICDIHIVVGNLKLYLYIL